MGARLLVIGSAGIIGISVLEQADMLVREGVGKRVRFRGEGHRSCGRGGVQDTEGVSPTGNMPAQRQRGAGVKVGESPAGMLEDGHSSSCRSCRMRATLERGLVRTRIESKRAKGTQLLERVRWGWLLVCWWQWGDIGWAWHCRRGWRRGGRDWSGHRKGASKHQTLTRWRGWDLGTGQDTGKCKREGHTVWRE